MKNLSNENYWEMDCALYCHFQSQNQCHFFVQNTVSRLCMLGSLDHVTTDSASLDTNENDNLPVNFKKGR